MIDEELIKEYVRNHVHYEVAKREDGTEYAKEVSNVTTEQAFLDGLKAGRPQWHDLEKDPTDLPKDKHNVWCKCLDVYGEGWYDKDTNTWTLIYRDYHVHCIEAWCEIPTFDKE